MGNLKEFEGKRIYIKLLSGKILTGTCESVDFVGNDNDNIPMFLFSMIERDGKFVAFSNREIKYVEEQQ